MAIDKTKKHAVGNLNSLEARDLPRIFASEDLENYSAVELYTENGVRKAKYATANAEEIFLAAAVEYYYDDEGVQHFYIGKDEGMRTVIFDKKLHFETSNYTPVSNTKPEIGQYASWDATNKTYQLSTSKPSNPVGGVVFEVVDVVSGVYGFGLPMVRLEVK